MSLAESLGRSRGCSEDRDEMARVDEGTVGQGGGGSTVDLWGISISILTMKASKNVTAHPSQQCFFMEMVKQ